VSCLHCNPIAAIAHLVAQVVGFCFFADTLMLSLCCFCGCAIAYPTVGEFHPKSVQYTVVLVIGALAATILQNLCLTTMQAVDWCGCSIQTWSPCSATTSTRESFPHMKHLLQWLFWWNAY
jgi:hypothetical protein